MTYPTGMDLMDHILVTIHGRGNHQRHTARADLHPPLASTDYFPIVQISPQDHRHSTLRMSWVASPTPPNLPFSRQASQEETLHESTLPGKQGISMSRTIPTFTRGAPYLLQVAIIAYKVGCQVERSLNSLTPIRVRAGMKNSRPVDIVQ